VETPPPVMPLSVKQRCAGSTVFQQFAVRALMYAALAAQTPPERDSAYTHSLPAPPHSITAVTHNIIPIAA